MAEDKTKPIQEVWVVKNGDRYRVYRGRSDQQVNWKLNHYENRADELELIVLPVE